MSIQSEHPVILTLKIDPDAAAFFTALRTTHFPAERNYLDAHLTLFHHLPGNEPAIQNILKTISITQKPMLLQVSKVVGIGAGVAYKIDCEELKNVHKSLQNKWQVWLTPQDKQALWPHITIQNKVAHQTALQLQQSLSVNFKPFEITGSGFVLWEYLGGPWKQLEIIDFKG